MRRHTPKVERPSQGKRHPLLLQQEFNEQNFWACILLMAASGGLIAWNPEPFAPYRPHLITLLVATGLILILTLLLRLRAYAQCHETGLVLQFPFLRLHIPYSQVKTSRPALFYRTFPPAEQRWTQRRFLRNLWPRTVVIVELEQLPRPRFWLRLWLSKYMLCPDAIGFVLPVRDWMAFRTEFDEFRTRRRQVNP